jgi:beta-lactamase regulating signal transducer with metallopeptidase domain
MIAVWMAYATVVGCMAVLAAVAVERALRALGRPGRFVWLCAILATLCATVLVVRPARRSAGEAPAAVGESVRAPAFAAVEWTAEAADEAARSAAWLDRPLLFAWVLASTVLVLLLTGSAVRLSLRRARWRRVGIGGLTVRVTDGLGPAVVGMVEPEIAVPAWVLELDAPSRALVLEHEWQHVRACDPQAVLVGIAAVALAPWNAALWWLLLRLRRSVEVDCDARVLASGPSPATYASLLIELGTRGADAPALAPALVDATSDLERRVAAILDARSAARPWRSTGWLVVGGVLALAPWSVPRPVVTLTAASVQADNSVGNPGAVHGVARGRVVIGRDTPRAGPSAMAATGGRGGARGIGASTSRGVRAAGRDMVVTRGGARGAGETGAVAGRDPALAAGVRAGASGGAGTVDAAGGGRGMRVGSGARVGATGLPFRLDSETIAALIALHHRDVLATATGDPPVIVFAFDTTGVVLRTRAVPERLAAGSVGGTLIDLFPELRGRRLRASGTMIGTIAAAGLPERRLRTIYGVVAPD